MIEKSNAKNINIASFWFNIKGTVTTSFITIYLLRLNATNFQLSLFEVLTALVGIIALVAFSVYLDSSKESYLKFTGLDRFTFILFATLLLFTQDPLLVIIGFSLYCIPYTIASVLAPNFMKEAIKKENWGRVFSKNKMVLIITNLLTLAAVGWLLDRFNSRFPNNFIIIFIISSITYVISYIYLRQITVQDKITITKTRLTRTQLLTGVDKNLMLMILANVFVFMAAPLWNIYHIRILHFSNMQAGMLAVFYSIGGLISLLYWGKLLDKTSNDRLFVWVMFLMAIIPLYYVLNNSYYYLLFAQFITGLFGNGFDLILQNRLMEFSQKADYDYAYISDYQIYQNVTRLGFPALGILFYSMFGIIATFIIIGLLRFIAAGIIFYSLKEETSNKEAEVII